MDLVLLLAISNDWTSCGRNILSMASWGRAGSCRLIIVVINSDIQRLWSYLRNRCATGLNRDVEPLRLLVVEWRIRRIRCLMNNLVIVMASSSCSVGGALQLVKAYLSHVRVVLIAAKDEILLLSGNWSTSIDRTHRRKRQAVLRTTSSSGSSRRRSVVVSSWSVLICTNHAPVTLSLLRLLLLMCLCLCKLFLNLLMKSANTFFDGRCPQSSCSFLIWILHDWVWASASNGAHHGCLSS